MSEPCASLTLVPGAPRSGWLGECYLVDSLLSSGSGVECRIGVIHRVLSPYFLLFSCREAMGHSGAESSLSPNSCPVSVRVSWGQEV